MTYPNPFKDRGQLPSTATMKAALANPAFFRAVSYKAAMESSTARYVAQRTPGGVVKLLNHPVTRMLSRRMNGYATPNRTLHTAIVHRDTTGNGYLLRRDRGDVTPWLVNLNPYDVVPFTLDDVKYFWLTSERRVLLADEVIHLMRFSVDGVSGLNPLDVFAQAFGLNATMNKFLVKYFRRNTVISGVIQCPPGVDLTPDQREKAAEDIAGLTLSSDSDRRYDVPFLPFGLQWVNVSQPTNEHTKIIEAMGLTERQISQISDLPPAVLFAHAAGGNLEDINADVVRSVLRIDFEDMEQEFGKLLTDAEQDAGMFVAFDEDSLLRGDPSRVDQLVKEVNAGTLTVNEYRRERDLPDIAGGDTPRMPVAVSQPISEGGKENAPKDKIADVGESGGAQEPTFANEVIR